MNDIDLKQVKDIFAEAIELDASARAKYLDNACAGDKILRGEVDAYLAAAERTNSLLGPGDHQETQLPQSQLAERPGTVIGPYRLLQQIGEGGMGIVFMAEQMEPIRRTVALKIIKPGMDSRQVLARFDAERQALALMDHPNIARVLDAGTTDTGRPFFVMELVKGIPITRYCDQHRLTIRQRLELLLPVCHALQHAHQKGLIHRDIKPTNVLVADFDERAVPKVIDFGVAKATAQRLTERTMFTELGQVVGTVEYMSPEQAKLNQLDVDTRSDIYSLGVLLYELLTGSTPIGRQRLRDAAFDEMLRIIREEDAPKPSTRLSSADTLPSVAASRGVEPIKLNRLVRGELDWIAMKCLEKDRDRRYATVNALAMDLARHLAGEPVFAGAPSRVYRLTKFVSRNKGAVFGATAFAALLCVSSVLATFGLMEQRRLRIYADHQRTLAEKSAIEATSQRDIAEAVSEFQLEMLNLADPDRGKGDKVTVLEAMTAASVLLDKGNTPPLVEASVRINLASTFRQLGRVDLAEPNARRALELYGKHLAPEHKTIRATLSHYAGVLLDLGRVKEAADIFKQITESDTAADPIERTKNRHNLASIYRNQGKFDLAEPLARHVLSDWRAAQGDHARDHPARLAVALADLSAILGDAGKLDEAELLANEALALCRKTYPPGHIAIADSLTNLAAVIMLQNRLTDSEPLFREALSINRAALPAGHPQIANSLGNMVNVMARLDRLDEASVFNAEALSIARSSFAAGSPNLALALHNHAGILLRLKRAAHAIPFEEESLAIMRKSMPADHPNLAILLDSLGTMYAKVDRLDSAEAAYREAASIARARLPEGDLTRTQMIAALDACVAERAKRAATQPTTQPTTRREK